MSKQQTAGTWEVTDEFADECLNRWLMLGELPKARQQRVALAFTQAGYHVKRVTLAPTHSLWSAVMTAPEPLAAWYEQTKTEHLQGILHTIDENIEHEQAHVYLRGLRIEVTWLWLCPHCREGIM